jgi:hypothetical protein
MSRPQAYGMAAQFEDAGRLVEAARAAREAGYRRIEAYSPYPIRELSEVLHGWDMVMPMALAAGIAGGFIGYYMQYFIAVDVYPTNIGGRPLNSWPMFGVITFEMIMLFSLIGVFFGTMFFEGLPALYHPLFRVPAFRQVSEDGFFLCIEARDGKYHSTYTAAFLESLDPVKVWEVDRE